MPLKDGIDVRPRVPRRGKIHLGEKGTTQQGKQYPKSLPHFRVPDEIKEFIGAEPTSLNVRFPYANPMDNVSYYFRRYGAGGICKCIGDGQTAMELGEDGQMHEIDCLGEGCPMYTDPKPKCRKVAKLSVILPDVPGIGIWQIDTASINTVLDLLGQMALVQGQGVPVTGVPFILERIPKQVAPDGKAKTVHVLTLKCPLTWDELGQRARLVPQIADKRDIEPVDETPADDLYSRDVRATEDGPGPHGYEEDGRVRAAMTTLDLTDAQQEALCREYSGRREELMAHLMKMAFGGNEKAEKAPVKTEAPQESIF